MNGTIRVLHVDDDPQFTELTGKFLQRESEQFETVSETRAEEALDYLSKSPEEIDCIVSDYALPDLDGLEFLAAVRESHPDLPFILFTGMGSESVARDALAGGATDYLQKEGGTEQYGLLANRIKDAVEQYRTKIEREWSERSRRELFEITSEPELDVDEKIDRLLKLGCDRIAVENGYVARIDTTTDTYEFVHVANTDLIQEGAKTDLQETFCRHTLDSNRPLAVYNAVEEGFEEDPAYEQWEIGCYIGGRIDIGDELYGTICFIDREPREGEFTEAERTFVNLVSRWLSHTFERQEYEQKLRQEKERFESLIEHSSDVITVIDEDGTVTYESPSVIRVLGYQQDELVGEIIFENIHPDDRESVVETFSQLFGTPEEVTETVRYRFRHKDGSWVWLESIGSNQEADLLDGYVANTRDVTEHIKRDRALEDREERFRSIAESATDAVLTIDTDSTIQFANQSVERIFGYEPEEVEGEPLTMLMPERFQDQHRDALDRYLETGERSLDWASIEMVGKHKDGQEIDLQISFSEVDIEGDHRFTGIIRI